MNWQRESAVVLFTIVFIIVFAIYFVTLAPGVVGGDAGEHQLAVPLLGIPHTTGYPLYVLVGHIWTRLIPLGSMAWRLNLFSALGGALASATTAVVVLRLTPVLRQVDGKSISGWPGGVLAGLILAWGLTLWQWSIIAGVRSFNILFFALLTYLAISWAEQVMQQQKSAETTLRWLALTVGLSMAHHRTTVFFLPSLLVWVVWYDRQLIRQPARLLQLAAISMLPLLLYAFIYFRGINNPPYTHEPIYDLQSFWFLVGSSDSAGLFMSIDPTYLPARLGFIWTDVLRQVSWAGIGLAAVGAGRLMWKKPAHFLFHGLLILLLLLFTLDFEVVNLNEAPTWYLMPAYFVLAVWAGVGVNGLFSSAVWLVDSRQQGHQPHGPQTTRTAQLIYTGLFIGAFAFLLGWPNWDAQARTSTAPLDEWRQLLRGVQAERFVESSLPLVESNSIIWSDWEQYTPLRYYQLINQIRTDVTVRNPLNRWSEKVAAAHIAGQPVYLARKPADLIGTPYLTMVGPLVRVGEKPNFTLPTEVAEVNVNFEDELELLGYQARLMPQKTPGGQRFGSILQITLYWRVPEPVQWDYALSLRLVNAGGQEFYKKDVVHPVLSSYPTSLWTQREVVGDYYEMPLSPNIGPVMLQILPYRTEGPGQWYNLTPVNAEAPGTLIGPFENQ
jgi:hypothetical protein